MRTIRVPPHENDCYNYSYTLNEKYKAILKAVSGIGDTVNEASDLNKDGKVDDRDFVTYIDNLRDDPQKVRKFADAVFKQIETNGIAEDATDTNKTFSSVLQGYYLIAETQTEGDTDSISLVMLDTHGQDNLNVTSKEGVPTLTKEVQEINDSDSAGGTWGKGADHDIGDQVSFRLTGTMPDNLADYAKYKYVFHDTLSAGLELVSNSVKVTIDGTTVPSADYDLRTSSTADGCSFEVGFSDIKATAKKLGINLTKDSKVIVEYKSLLTENAVTSKTGNKNDACLEFSNDPYHTDDPTKTKKTPIDTNVTFTYKLVVNKVDEAKNPLAGANFELQKFIANKNAYETVKTINLQDGQTEFNFVGLDAGKYKLVETQVPDGYNKADDVEFEIVSEYGEDETTGEMVLKNLVVKQGETVVSAGEEPKFATTIENGQVATSIINIPGVRLPSTGGAGTYLLYGAGVVLLVAGGSLFVLKKKKLN